MEITENLQAALTQFTSIVEELEETALTRPSITVRATKRPSSSVCLLS